MSWYQLAARFVAAYERAAASHVVAQEASAAANRANIERNRQLADLDERAVSAHERMAEATRDLYANLGQTASRLARIEAALGIREAAAPCAGSDEPKEK